MMKILGLSLFFIFLFLTCFAYAINKDPALVFYCSFEEGKGDTTKDLVSGMVGTITGAKWTNDGKSGKGIEFVNAGDKIEFPEDKIMDITEAITMEAWIYPIKVQGDSSLFGRRTAANAGGYCMQWTNAMVETWIHIGGWQGVRDKQTVKPTVKEWHHVAGVFDGKQIVQYVDGEVDIKNANAAGKMGSVKEPFRIGQAQTGLGTMEGIIDEVAVYKRALTQDEIKLDMKTGIMSPVSPKGSLTTTWGFIKGE